MSVARLGEIRNISIFFEKVYQNPKHKFVRKLILKWRGQESMIRCKQMELFKIFKLLVLVEIKVIYLLINRGFKILKNSKLPLTKT